MLTHLNIVEVIRNNDIPSNTIAMKEITCATVVIDNNNTKVDAKVVASMRK
jgi:hypothetical protein